MVYHGRLPWTPVCPKLKLQQSLGENSPLYSWQVNCWAKAIQPKDTCEYEIPFMKVFCGFFLPLLCSFLSRGLLNVLLFIIILFFWGEAWITDCHEFSKSRESLSLASLGMIFRCEMSARVEAISFKLIVSITVPLVFFYSVTAYWPDTQAAKRCSPVCCMITWYG